MGNLCSKKKDNDTASIRSEESGKKKDSAEAQENHSLSSKRSGHQNGTQKDQGQTSGTGGSVSTAAADSPARAQSSTRGRILTDAGPSSFSADSMASSPTTTQGFFDSSFTIPLPLEVQKQSDNAKNLLFGRVAQTKPVRKTRKITLYVCASNSQDFQLEKGNFHKEVYPELREHCSKQGYELHIADLHWTSDGENKRNHELPQLCLDELRRQLDVSYVIPVLFLSNSLGTLLLPRTVEQQDFEMALKNVDSPDSKNLLDKWYTLDSHAQPPCYQLKTISTHIPNIDATDEKLKTAAINEWHDVVDQMLAIMLKVFPTELRDSYLTSVIEQEIHNSIFMSRELGRRSVWIQRVFTHLQQSQDVVEDSIETEKTRRLQQLHNELKNQLVGDHILRLLVKWHDGGLSIDHSEHKEYLRQVTTQLTTQLRSIIAEIIEEDQSKAVWKSCFGLEGNLFTELMEHTMFCQQAAKCSLPIESTLTTIKEYIESEKKHPLVIHGDRGCGKSCLMSRIVQQGPTWFSDTIILFRFVGLTADSRSLVQLLRTLFSQLSSILVGRTPWIPHNSTCYQKELFQIFSSGSSPPLLILVLDGLDELNPTAQTELEWLWAELPNKMKLIVSCANDSTVFQSLKANIKADAAFINMSPLDTKGAETLLNSSILQYCHSTDSEVQKRLCTRLQHCSLPLFIKVLAWQASIDTQGREDTSRINDVPSAINNLFDLLEKSLGAEKIHTALSLMCASRYGLSDSELLDLLAHTSTFRCSSSPLEWSPASIFLAQMYQSLGPFLEWSTADGATIVRWRDAAMEEFAKKRYLPNGGMEKKSRLVLLEYFNGKVDNKKDGRQWKSCTSELNCRHHRRKLVETPYQEYHANSTIKTSYLSNIDWIRDKIQAGLVFNIIDDILMECKGNLSALSDDLNLLLKTLSLSAPCLNCDGGQLYGQIFARLRTYFQNDVPSCTENNKKYPFMRKLYDASVSPAITTFIPFTPETLHSPLDLDEWMKTMPSFVGLSNGDIRYNEIVRMKTGHQIVLTLSSGNEDLQVWNLYSDNPLRVLSGMSNPINLRVINDHRVVVLCGRELLVFDLNEVKLVSKMKGVMNQKMPYYGLHSEELIACLSRNRMYVHLMNVESGDCVTTFKVGEDRFLNSLIVSDNGKMLVCGDETQKPFPLLVWDLTSRKLIYDLRIPHHEFLTNLSAITKEGHFVCCVCREVDDPGPNFIVVYDLQSGTLFKKWKPGCNTNAITISAQGSCVINGLEDNRILVWDLVTGACQWTLNKHTAPVDILRLDEKGSRCISCDSTGRDRTICLWDITAGSLIALFTPDIPFSACELSNSGNELILGLKGKKSISTILCRKNSSIYDEEPTEPFGDEANKGKTTNLKEAT